MEARNAPLAFISCLFRGLTVIHVADGVEGVDPAAHDAALPLQHPAAPSAAVPGAGFLSGGLLRNARLVGGGAPL